MTDILKNDYATKPVEYISHSNKMMNLERETTSHIYKSDIHDNREEDDDNKLSRNENFYSHKYNHYKKNDNNKLKESESKSFNTNGNISFMSKLEPTIKTEHNKKLNVNLNQKEMLFNKRTNEFSTKLTLDHEDYENNDDNDDYDDDRAYYLSSQLLLSKKQNEELKNKQQKEKEEKIEINYSNSIKTTKPINLLAASSTTTTTKTTTTTTTTTSNEIDNQNSLYEDINCSLYNNDDEFQSILKRMQSSTSNKTNNPCSINSLKYLYKLLKFYKLDHYMNDLIDCGYSSPVSLRKLSSTDLDSLSVSPYDKKKFARLQLFIKQVMNTINKTNSAQSKELNDEKLNNGIDSLLAKSNSLNGLNSNGLEWEAGKKKSDSQRPKESHTTNSTSSNKLINNRPASFAAYIKQSPYTSNSNLSDKKSKPSSTGFTKTQSSHSLNQRQVANNIGPRRKHEIYQGRAKSTEPSACRTTSTVNRTNSSKSQLHTNRHQAPISSVCHPVQHSKTSAQQKPNAFFGPSFKPFSEQQQQQQHQQQKSSGNQMNEIKNVKLIRTNSYNYGVPQPQETNTLKRQKSFNGGFIKPTFAHQHNQLNEPNKQTPIHTSDIYVFARKRPKLDTESQFDDVVYIENSLNLKEKRSPATTAICINEVKSAVDGTPILRKNEFTFDRTYDSFYTNRDIFSTSLLPFIDLPAESRTDFACICFGQTGSGKTHTLFGNAQIDGLCVLTAEHLLKTNERLFCGFYEIYNGQLFDLINQSNKLVLREDSNGQLNVVGLVEVEIKNASQLRKTIEQAQANRHIGSTSFNKASSRSHAVIQFKCPNEPTHQPAMQHNICNQNGHVIYKKQLNSLANVKSKINTGLNKKQEPLPFRVNFIDLAGSERGIDAQNNQKDNRKEGAEINQSLLALKECIRSLDQSCLHAPFRQSKLTRVLRDCFVGTGRTVVISTVSPTDDCVSCSLNTLQYANRIRQMTLRNRKKNDTFVRKLNGAIEITAEHVFQKDEHDKPAPLQTNGSLNDLAKGATLKSNSNVLKTEPARNPSVPNSVSKTIRSSSLSSSNTRQTLTNLDTNDFHANMAKSHNPAADVVMFAEKPTKPISTLTSSGTFSGGSAAAVLASKYIASVNLEANNVLPSKPYSTSTSSANKYNQPMPLSINPLFHPSKINMSSTPIKTSMTSNEENGQTEPSINSNVMFENDTPIKGHRFKVMMQNSNKIAELAERYFQKSELKAKHDYLLNEKIDSKKVNNNASGEQEQSKKKKKNKNEDEESGVESDELNKSLNKLSQLMRTKSTTSADLLTKSQSQKEFLNNLKLKTNLISNLIRNGSSSSSSSLSLTSNNSTHKRQATSSSTTTTTTTTTSQMSAKQRKELLLKRFDSIYKSNSPVKVNNARLSEHDDTLVELRRKQRELFESKKLQSDFKNRFDSTSLSLNDYDDDDDYMLFARKNDLSVSNHCATTNTNSQTQLKSYIQNLETKLVNLKKEMHDTSSSNEKYLQEMKSRTENNQPQQQQQQQHQQENNRERRFSTESSDSMKELTLNEQSAQTNYAQMLLMKKRAEEKREKAQQQSNQQQQQQQQQQFADDDYERLFIETQIEKQNKPRKDEEDDDVDEDAGNDLKKSLHKGNSTDLFFSSIKNRQEKIERDFCIMGKCDFSPINKVDDEEEVKSDKLRANSHEPDLAKSVQFSKHHQPQLLNPIPIRLSSSSSSFESFIAKAKQLDGTDQTTTQPLNNDNLNSPRSLNDANSSLKISNSSSKIWKMANPLRESIGQKWCSLLSENTQRQLELTDESSKQSGKVSLNFSNTQNEEESFESIKTKKLLVAHENQISNLAEACKKEMNLLNCLKDSQMNFDEYLIKMEEMLTKKVDSIKDLQNQINQLKSTNNSSNLLNLNSTPQLS